MLHLRTASQFSNLAFFFFASFYSAQKMLNLRAASRLSNLACLFSLRITHSNECSIFESSSTPLEPRTFFVSVYFASLMQRKYLAEFLELKKSQRLIFSTISFNASQARYAVLSIVSGVSVTYPSMIPWTSVPCSFRWTTSPQIQ